MQLIGVMVCLEAALSIHKITTKQNFYRNSQ